MQVPTPDSGWTMETLTPASSNVYSYRYHAAGRILEVTFQDKDTGLNGAVYHYSEVPAALYREMQNAVSVGKFLASAIKPRFTAQKML